MIRSVKYQAFFMVTLPCHSLLPGTKLTKEDVDEIFAQGIDIQSLSIVLDNDISEVRDYVRDTLETKSGTKSGTKSLTKSLTKSGTSSGTKLLTMIPEMIEFLNRERSRTELFEFLELENQTLNYNNIKPLIDFGLMEMTLPKKPNSRYQKYRLTEQGKKLLKQ